MNPIRYEFLLPLIAESPALSSGGRIVAIDGPSGAGKTTLADALSEVLDAPVLTVDELCPGWDGLDEVPGLLAATLEPLAHGDVGSYQRYDWKAGRLAERVDFGPTGLLLVDGVGSGSRACRPWLSLMIWLEAEAGYRKARALERDGDGFAREWDRWAAHESTLFAREQTRTAADVLLTADPDQGILAIRPANRGDLHA
ncbi:MAG: 4-amino-4-deoxy-L-arabinose transferase [Propionibacteriales bacterium]|nr:4-amino-4-deoxy-L-arabinose transferase [Propionibacteriales bacterium]